MFYIVDFITMFYINELISLELMKEGTTFIPSHAKFHDDFYKFKNFFDAKLAQIFHDYIIFSATKELLEAWKYCEESPDYLLGEKIYFLSEKSIEDNIYKLDIRSFYKMAEYIYGKAHWEHLFGGKKWYKAIKINELYGKIQNSVFCDLIIDLQHNTGSLLNKKNPYFSVSGVENKLRKIIDRKAKGKNFNNIFNFLLESINIQDKRIFDIYWRFITLYLGNGNKSYWLSELLYVFTYGDTHYQNEFFTYKPVQYTGRYKKYNIKFSCDIQGEYSNL